MNFNTHSHLAGKHAFLSASKYHWVNYSEDKLGEVFLNQMAAQKGTELHNFAAEAIRLGINLPRNDKTLNKYVNDVIGFRMKPEQILYYSDNAFGTADAISFSKNRLRIFDLKTGISPVSPMQLEVYAALFCLEYNMKPGELDMDLRIYQNDEILHHQPELDSLVHIMDRIVSFDRIINELRLGVL